MSKAEHGNIEISGGVTRALDRVLRTFHGVEQGVIHSQEFINRQMEVASSAKKSLQIHLDTESVLTGVIDIRPALEAHRRGVSVKIVLSDTSYVVSAVWADEMRKLGVGVVLDIKRKRRAGEKLQFLQDQFIQADSTKRISFNPGRGLYVFDRDRGLLGRMDKKSFEKYWERHSTPGTGFTYV